MTASQRPPRPKDSAARHEVRRRALAYAVLTILALAVLGPFFITVLASFRTQTDYNSSSSVIPSTWTLVNYQTILGDSDMPRMILNSLIVAVLGTVGALLASYAAAFCLAKLRFPYRATFFGLVLGLMLIPAAVTLIPMYIILRGVGLLDTLWALILPSWLGGAFFVFFLRQHLLSVPHELYEAARLDGASIPGIMFRVYMPQLYGPLAILAILQFISEWNDLLRPLIFLNSRENMTATVGLTLYRGEYVTNFPVILAGSIVLLIPTTLVFLLFNRQLRAGLAVSGNLK